MINLQHIKGGKMGVKIALIGAGGRGSCYADYMNEM